MPVAPQPVTDRQPQLGFSELQEQMHDGVTRRQKAGKIVSVLKHFLGQEDLSGLTALDVGCSTGYTVEALLDSGASVTGIDIDEPAMAIARERLGDRATFKPADGSAIPLDTASVDIVVFNHIYEHTVDADAVVAEIRRVLRPDGAVYLGLGNRYGVMEPHYRLPFLSWLPYGLADRYIKRAGRADTYYERFRSRSQLVQMCRAFTVWDYTFSVLSESQRFNATDMVPSRLAGLPARAWRLLTPIIPTFIWVGTPDARRPAGPALREAPTRIGAG